MQSHEPNINSNTPQQEDGQNYMNTLTAVVNKVVKSGYTDSFKVTKQGLYSSVKANYYNPSQVRIINFYRFEGQSDPADNTILYVIETDDDQKGTLIDAYGPYSDEATNKFMNEVEEMQKQIKTSQQNSPESNTASDTTNNDV